MLVKDVMKRQGVTDAPDASIRDVARLMSEIDAGIIPVIEGDVVGLVTDRDTVVRAVAESIDVGCPISTIMTSGIESCLESTEPREAAGRMSELQMRRASVASGTARVQRRWSSDKESMP